jgi:hypothetical protein
VREFGSSGRGWGGGFAGGPLSGARIKMGFGADNCVPLAVFIILKSRQPQPIRPAEVFIARERASAAY